MEYELGAAADELRQELRAWCRPTSRPDFLGAFTADPADLAGERRTSATSSPSRDCSAWPGRRSSAGAAARPGSRPSCARRCGRTTSRAARSTWGSTGSGPTIMRHGTPRAAAQAPAADRPRRGDLVPGLQRAGRRLRPRLAAHRGPARRRRLAHLRPEDLDLLRDDGAVVLPARPHLARGDASSRA